MAWLPKHCVVVPFDFSSESVAAVDLALGMVSRPAEVHVVHVLSELSFAERPFASSEEAALDGSRLQYAEGVVRRVLEEPKYAGLTLKIAIGDAGHEIVEYASEVGAELIMLPSHGRTGLRRFLIGSVAERVVRFAHCPVLVLRS